MSDWSHTASWPADHGAVSQVRGFVRECLGAHRRDRLAFVVSLVASELATNAVVHAGTPFKVTLASRGGGLLLTVRDASAAVPPLTPADALAPGGRGLTVVEALSEAWGISPDGGGGKSVWASFDGGAQVRATRAAKAGAGEAAGGDGSPSYPHAIV